MMQYELWLSKYHKVLVFMEANHINPSKYDPLEWDLYYNWIIYNKKLLRAGKMKNIRIEMFDKLLEKCEDNKMMN